MTAISRSLFALFASASLLLLGCRNDALPNLATFPESIGVLNRINLVCDDALWESQVGDTIRYYYQSPYPLLPQPEPIYDILQLSPQDMAENPRRQLLRVLLYVADLSDDSSASTLLVRKAIGEENIRRAQEDPSFGSLVRRDVWAQQQVVIYLFAHGEAALAERLKRALPAIDEQVKRVHLSMLHAQAFAAGDNYELNARLRDAYQIDIKMPADYKEAMQEDRFIWLRKDAEKYISNIFLYRFPYTDAAQLELDYLKTLRDSLGRYVSSDKPGSRMVINDRDLPVIAERRQLNGAYALEARGIWEMEKDFMGGAYVTYFVLDEKRSEVLVLDGFVYAPGEDKRRLMEHLTHIFSQVKLI